MAETLTPMPVFEHIRPDPKYPMFRPRGVAIRQRKNETESDYQRRRALVHEEVVSWDSWRTENRKLYRAQLDAEHSAAREARTGAGARQRVTSGSFEAPHSVMRPTVPEDLEKLRDGVEVLTGRRTSGDLSSTTSGVGPERPSEPGRRTDMQANQWRVAMALGQPWEVLIHEFGHVIYTKFDAPQVVEANPLVKSLWGAIEDGRIDRMAGEHFGKPLLEVHQDALSLAEPGQYGGEIEALVLGAAQMAMGMDRKRSSFINAEQALDAYAQEIAEASLNADPMGPIGVAVRLAEYMGVVAQQEQAEPEPSKNPDAPEASGEGGTDVLGRTKDGDGAEQPDEAGKSNQPMEPNQPDGQGGPDGAASEPADTSGDGAGTSVSQALSPDALKERAESQAAPLLQEAQAAITSSLNKQEAMAKEAKSLSRFSLDYGRLTSPSDSDYDIAHSVTLTKAQPHELEPVVASNAMKLMLDGLPEPSAVPRRELYGQPTADVWKLNIGQTRVFERIPKTRGRLLVAVDMSSSMHSGSPSNADKAWDIVGALTQRNPDAEVYGYYRGGVHGGRRNLPGSGVHLLQVPAGMKPKDGWRGDTPDCAMLLWLREHLAGDMAGTTMVIISDGLPNQPCADPVGHTRRLAQAMYDEGTRYASILIGGYWDSALATRSTRSLYPSDIVAVVGGIESKPLTSTDLSRIEDVFTYIQESR
jgi:hypothetical protein